MNKEEEINKLHAVIYKQLDFFLEKNCVPHIIFHGVNGSGKKTIVHRFIQNIYKKDKHKIKQNVMFVNCAQAKGIKFIREELKFFAKTNIHINSSSTDNTDNCVLFKTIILMNADYLTIDAQSALRRCIEVFSYNTRFFIIVENKNKLLYPILSRFCEFYVPEYIDPITKKPLNLHNYHLQKNTNIKHCQTIKKKELEEHLDEFLKWLFVSQTSLPSKKYKTIQQYFANLAETLYSNGFSALDVIEFVENCEKWRKEQQLQIAMSFYKIKSEYRNEKILMFYIFQQMVVISTSVTTLSTLTQLPALLILEPGL